jgi:hypothetical protein
VRTDGRTDGARRNGTREREREEIARTRAAAVKRLVRHSRAKDEEEEEEGRRKKKGQKEGPFLSLLQTNAHLNAVLSPTMFFHTFVQIVNF